MDGGFENPPTITIAFSNLYTARGITLESPQYDYISSINVQWFRGQSLRASKSYQPTGGTFFCQQLVEAFDRIEITINQTAIPNRHAKINKLYIGTYKFFDINVLRDVTCINECDFLTNKLPASQCQWVLDTQDDVDYLFQFKQPIEVTLDDDLIGVYYITTSDKRRKGLYYLNSQNAFGVMETIPFSPKRVENQGAAATLRAWIGNRFPLYITASDRVINGVFMGTNLREAVRQLLFAWGVCAATDGCDGIRVFNLSTDEKEKTQYEVYDSISVKDEALVTRVNVTAHSYSEDSGGSIEIGGVKYKDTPTVFSVSNPLVTANDLENVKSFSSATLVSPKTAQATAKGAYNYYAGRRVTSTKVLWDREYLGDPINLPNFEGGVESGNIEKMEIVLSETKAAKITLRKTLITTGNVFAGDVFAGEVDAW